jgi:CBS domain-containing protein
MRTIRHIIEGRPIHSVTVGRTVRGVVQDLADKQVGAVPVVDGERLAGIFSERDLITRVLARGLDLDRTRVEQVMTVELITARPDEEYGECLRMMQAAKCRHLPVVDQGRLIGFLSIRDLLVAAVDDKQLEVKQLSAYIHGASADPSDAEKPPA